MGVLIIAIPVCRSLFGAGKPYPQEGIGFTSTQKERAHKNYNGGGGVAGG